MVTGMLGRQWMVLRIVCFVLLLGGVLLAGCGYRLAGSGSGKLAATGRSVAVPMFDNRSYHPNLEAIQTASLIDVFAHMNGGRVVDKETADLVLTGSIESYELSPLSYTAQDKIKEYRITMRVKAVLRERASQRVLWRGELARNRDYPADTVMSLQQNREDAAIQALCDDIARLIYLQADSDF